MSDVRSLALSSYGACVDAPHARSIQDLFPASCTVSAPAHLQEQLESHDFEKTRKARSLRSKQALTPTQPLPGLRSRISGSGVSISPAAGCAHRRVAAPSSTAIPVKRWTSTPGAPPLHWDDRPSLPTAVERSTATHGDLAIDYRLVTPQAAQEARGVARVALNDRIRDLNEPADIAYAAAEILGKALGVNMPVSEHGSLVALLYVNHETSHDDLAFIREVGERTRSAVARRLAERQLCDLADSLERQVFERTRERDRTWNTSQDPLVVVDLDSVFRAVNPAWSTILGWKAEDLVGHRYLDFVHPDDRAASEASLLTTSTTRLPRFENRVRHSDGSYRWVAWVASPEADLVYASGRHVTAEKEAAIELESGSLELLEMLVAQGRSGEIERYVRAAQGAAKRAAALTHRLLAFSRRQTLDPKAVDVDPSSRTWRS